jgi:hypothetical protein
MSVSRAVAIVLTVVSVLLCGLPGLALFCFGSLGGIGGLLPGTLEDSRGTTEDLFAGVVLFVCGGLFMMAIPLVVGWVSFQVSKAQELPLVKYE